LKYPEYKPRANEWVIRQTGIHHRFNSTTGQNVYVLFNPVPSSKVHLAAQEQLRNKSQETKAEPFWLHRVLFATYFPAWRQYIAALEREFLPIANGVNVAYIDEPLRVGFENLSTTMSLQKRFLQISTLLAPAADVLDAMDILLKSISQTIATLPGTQQFKNYNRQCIAYSRMATSLQHRSQMTAQLLTDTLSFRDQVVAKQQNENMLQLNKSAVFVTFLTLFYLPASFLTVSFR
jgi:Mg2+ and Co2+ transporter CorA